MSALQEALTTLRAQYPARLDVDYAALGVVLASFTETRILQEVSTHRPTGYILGEVPPKSFIKLVWDVVRDDGVVYQVEERLTFLDSAQGAAAAEMLEAMVIDKVERPYSRDPNPDMRQLLPHPAFTAELAQTSKEDHDAVVADLFADQVARKVAGIFGDALG
jgi:hypothetical protein